MTSTRTSPLFIGIAIVAAPVIADGIPRVRVPVVVVEIVLGTIVGPQLLGLARVDPVVNGLSQFGLAFLFFVVG
jgi:Kef-type K+ transport system membrane component KefB